MTSFIFVASYHGFEGIYSRQLTDDGVTGLLYTPKHTESHSISIEASGLFFTFLVLAMVIPCSLRIRVMDVASIRVR